MKPQDLIFLIALLTLILYKRAKYTWLAGMFCLIASGCLFLFGNLFTAQRLTWYGAAFIATYCTRSALHYIPKR